MKEQLDVKLDALDMFSLHTGSTTNQRNYYFPFWFPFLSWIISQVLSNSL